jgi:hypothetical protein
LGKPAGIVNADPTRRVGGLKPKKDQGAGVNPLTKQVMLFSKVAVDRPDDPGCSPSPAGTIRDLSPATPETP